MFQCRACTLRCVRAIAGDAYTPRLLSRRALALASRPLARHASTVATAPPPEDFLVPGKQPVASSQDAAEEGSDGKRMATSTERHLRFELQYLQDRVKLAEHVQYTLRRGMPEKALDLVRLASKKQDVIVGWNHIIDYYLQKNQVDLAIKIYNEMKKRAQFPDGHTYSILLRGLALPKYKAGVVPASNVTKALSIYYSMDSPTSRVKPNIIHTNNVLTVCKAACDMDALWGVVSKLPDEGANAPDHITYAVLLDAIRLGAFGNGGEGLRYDERLPFEETVSYENIPKLRVKAVQEGRAIWRDVVTKWRAGQLQIDERLVVSMARLLMMSDRINDWDDVLNLVQQTMNIERQLAPLDSPERQTEHVPQDHAYRLPAPPPEEDERGYTDAPATKAFLPVKPHMKDSAFPSRPSTLPFVQPGSQTLSLLIGACENLRSPKTASAYWDLLTSGPYNVQPTLQNFHTLLRLFGKNRSSAKAVALLETMKIHRITPTMTTFRVVMGVVVRDKNNPNALDHARQIIDIMESTLADPDVLVLNQYLNLALLSDNGPRIIFAVDRMDSVVHTLRSRVLYGSNAEVGKPEEQHLREKEEILSFFRTLVGVIDTLSRRGLVPATDHTYWQGRRAVLDKFIQHNMGNTERAFARLDEQKGVRVPRMNDLNPRKGMRMTDAELGLRQFRHQRVVKAMEEEKEQVRGLKRWADERRAKGWKERATKQMESKRLKSRPVNDGFAMSPMELGERETDVARFSAM